MCGFFGSTRLKPFKIIFYYALIFQNKHNIDNNKISNFDFWLIIKVLLFFPVVVFLLYVYCHNENDLILAFHHMQWLKKKIGKLTLVVYIFNFARYFEKQWYQKSYLWSFVFKCIFIKYIIKYIIITNIIINNIRNIKQ